MKQLSFVLLLCVLSMRSEAGAFGGDVPFHRGDDEASRAAHLQSMTDDLRGRLQINEKVHIVLVDHNPLVMSVETLSGRSGPFVISVDREFINELNDQELEAALAHELGHVWIYTHHPYLQTERLANEVAMRVTSRAVLQPVYEKVWQRTGIRGNLAEFIGEEAPCQTPPLSSPLQNPCS
jgi:hypothetical protein